MTEGPSTMPELSRRHVLAAAGGGLALAVVPTAGRAAAATPMRDLDPVRTELVMNLVVTCSAPEPMGPSPESKDGRRGEIWPIVGGRFEGPNIRGTVVPGGGDFPVTRPDGVEVIDALYRLKTDDGVTILIHNRGLMYPGRNGEWPKFRLVPEFTAPVGRYDWLNKAIFLSTLVETPKEMALAKSSAENDRLIQVHRVF
ncbi:DUF3237 domain-containing protein [Novosphingobium sp. PS1R-30]|uniref:DUF3237 domain-containing protein n=1 Tax=Novosphingobium anseongense TaxID=3133436 RepID=A0ABU8S344_9SPHN